jgi:cell shape-determining protein MreC
LHPHLPLISFFNRERNKVLARKTRCKKKAEFETLRKQLLKLRTENDRLKELVKVRVRVRLRGQGNG